MGEYIDESFNTSTIGSYNNDINLWKLRLSTDNIWEQVEMYLSGHKVVEELRDDGTTYRKKIKIGKPKANNEGIFAIMNIIQSNINSAVVQGNMDSKDYYGHLRRIHINIATELKNNLYNWEIKEDDYPSINNFIMSLCIPFLSRTINNKERDSYSNTMKTVQTIQDNIRAKGGFFGER
jgi:hypothetical protein